MEQRATEFCLTLLLGLIGEKMYVTHKVYADFAVKTDGKMKCFRINLKRSEKWKFLGRCCCESACSL